MFCIAALGNPGSKYEHTRHNAGWILLDEMFPNASWGHSSVANAEYAKVSIAGQDAELLKPQTFMNESGQSIAFSKKKHALQNNQIIVLHDEIDLPLGVVKISIYRGDAGHNGIKSTTAHLGGNDYYRIRIGFTQVLEDGRVIKPDVLKNFQDDELKKLKDLAPRVHKALEILINQGYEKAATFLHSEE